MNDALLTATLQFVESFETVFRTDWAYTRSMLCVEEETPEQAEHAAAMGTETIPLIAKGAFLEPEVDDETENWGNRGILLLHYRRLKELLDLKASDPHLPTQ